MDVARRGVHLARTAAADGGRADDVAVAFSINGDVDTPDGRETIRLLARAFEEEPPDLILLETLSLVRDLDVRHRRGPARHRAYRCGSSFRRCRHGVCGVYGEHWGGPEGDAFGRAARRFEEMGVGALLINCIPPDHVPGMLSWLRDFTDLPLGVYPNLGYLSVGGLALRDRRRRRASTRELAPAVARRGRADHRRLLRRRPEHLAATRAALEGTKPGHARPARRRRELARTPLESTAAAGRGATPAAGACSRWTSRPHRASRACSSPRTGSFLVWKYLYREGIGAHSAAWTSAAAPACSPMQLARNGAAHVHAIDIDERAVENTLTNAFRNGVADRVSAIASTSTRGCRRSDTT